MKKLIFLCIVVAAVWYGYHHYPELIHRTPRHEVVVENHSGHPIERLRVIVGGQTFVREKLEPNGTAVFPFRVNADSPFELTWQYGDAIGEFRWRGGFVAAGPMVQRHGMSILDRGGVSYYQGRLESH